MTEISNPIRWFQRDINQCLTQYDEVYKNLTKNQTQLLITDLIAEALQSDIVSNSSTNESESHRILSSDGNDIPTIRKEILIVHESNHTN